MPIDPQRTDTLVQLEALANIYLSTVTVVPAVAAATAYEIPVYKAPALGSATAIRRLSIAPATAIAGAATNFQTLQFRVWRAGAFLALITGATTYATTASLAVQTESVLFAVSTTVALLYLLPNDIITLQNATSGTGAALPVIAATIEASPVAAAFTAGF
jgi:hypothetical protein